MSTVLQCHYIHVQGVQAAVDHQLTLLASAHPSNKVALVTFGDEVTATPLAVHTHVTQFLCRWLQVTVVGDGRGQEVTLAGDKLWNLDAIVKMGGEIPLPGLIKDTHKKLSKKVFE